MDRTGASELTFSPTIDTKILREAGIGFSSTYTIMPGFCDVHAHFREPVFSYKRTVATASMAAAHGGYTAVCTLSDTDPAADPSVHRDLQQAITNDDVHIRGICSEPEWRQMERDIRLADEAGHAFHVCNVSTKEGISIIREAKKSGVNVTCETAPHYLLLDDSLIEEGGKWKIDPPLRSASDREALLEGLSDGTIDCIASGTSGIETAFPLVYTYLVMPGIITMDRLEQLLVYNPRRIFGIPLGNDYSVWDLTEEWSIENEELLSTGSVTPFEGWRVMGRNYLTVCGGTIAYSAAW